MHHGTMIGVTLESSRTGHKTCSSESSRDITCVDAREAFRNAPEVNSIWMRYNDDWNTRTPDTLCSHWLIASLSSAICATARELRAETDIRVGIYRAQEPIITQDRNGMEDN